MYISKDDTREKDEYELCTDVVGKKIKTAPARASVR